MTPVVRTNWTADIATASAVAQVPADLIEAMVVVESGGNPWAVNAEPKYRYFWDVAKHAPFRLLSSDDIASKIPPPDFRSIAGDRDQEWWCQQVSFGLLQIMGALARELGFRGPYLTRSEEHTSELQSQ